MKKIYLLFILVVTFATYFTNANATVNSDDKIRVNIMFKDKVDKSYIASNGGKVIKELKNIPMVNVEIPQKTKSVLEKNKYIDFIEEDGTWGLSAQVLPWGVDNIDAELVHLQNITGKGIKVGVIDTGIYQHEDLNVEGGWNFIDNNSNFYDDNGHGTHVAGIIGALNNSIGVIGISPDIQLYSLKAINSKGNANWSSIAQAIDWAITNKLQILNMSFGGTTGSKTVEKVLNKAYNSGILLVAAAGNQGLNDVNYPAKYSTVIAVGATDIFNNIATFSNRGPKLELVAPGVNIYSCYINNSYSTLSGTSMASPHVVGAAALLWSKSPLLTNIELRNKLKTTAKDLGNLGFDYTYGYGIVNPQS